MAASSLVLFGAVYLVLYRHVRAAAQDIRRNRQRGEVEESGIFP